MVGPELCCPGMRMLPPCSVTELRDALMPALTSPKLDARSADKMPVGALVGVSAGSLAKSSSSSSRALASVTVDWDSRGGCGSASAGGPRMMAATSGPQVGDHGLSSSLRRSKRTSLWSDEGK